MDAASNDNREIAPTDNDAVGRRGAISADNIAWILEHLPHSRIFGAFVRDDGPHGGSRGTDSRSYQPASLLDTCIRVVVPFDTVCDTLQARLPVLDFDPRRGGPDPSEHAMGAGRPLRHWVIVPPSGEGRGRLRPISQRDGERIALWHWVGLVTLGYIGIRPILQESLDDAIRVMPPGYHHNMWLKVIGRPPREQPTTASEPVVLVNHMLPQVSARTRRDAQDLRAEALERHVRTAHPWGDHIHVHACPMSVPGELPRIRMIGWIDGDDDFIVFSGFEVMAWLF